MEESKNLQGLYTAFRFIVYISLIVEFFEYAVSSQMLEPIGQWLVDIQERIGRWSVYQSGHMPYSKLTTLLLVIICCIGTKNKKQLEFDARKMVFWPLSIGLFLMALSVWLFDTDFMNLPIAGFAFHIWLYAIASIVGTVSVHVALDNVSKYLKEGMLKDRFNFENESFEQNEEYKSDKYSVEHSLWVLPDLVRHSPSSSRLSVSIVRRDLQW